MLPFCFFFEAARWNPTKGSQAELTGRLGYRVNRGLLESSITTELRVGLRKIQDAWIGPNEATAGPIQ